ncbi:hypothetical protein FHX15_002576 [Rhizobium sp. BK650]|uniref:hypothetical protein n=1 Tax=Rhizobium sp. BK650 TaxID=2586990 RepID=UPI00161BCDAA|nr:hypothetical protein [Rhizobium sp. BK650]MBB3657344.1 hypothetical protein [Rhizobium sp. BK650]
MLPTLKIQDGGCHAITNLCSTGVYESLTETLLLKRHKLGRGATVCLSFIKKAFIFSVFMETPQNEQARTRAKLTPISRQIRLLRVTGQRLGQSLAVQKSKPTSALADEERLIPSAIRQATIAILGRGVGQGEWRKDDRQPDRHPVQPMTDCPAMQPLGRQGRSSEVQA